MDSYLIWLIAGVVFFVAEAMGMSGVGLLFAGFGGLTTGTIVTFTPDLSPLVQWLIFLVSTSAWAFALWKPFKKFRTPATKDSFSNMIGDTAYVGTKGLQKGMHGEATWSGTIMRAELAEGAEPLAPGAQATIVGVSGSTLILKPKV